MFTDLLLKSLPDFCFCEGIKLFIFCKKFPSHFLLFGLQKLCKQQVFVPVYRREITGKLISYHLCLLYVEKLRVTCQMVEIHGWSLAGGNLSDGSFDKTSSISILYIKGRGSVKGGNSFPKEGDADWLFFFPYAHKSRILLPNFPFQMQTDN